ncbi:MAG TPA: hypothetical protein VKF40_06890 [Burkholderiales bacterium]|nr:hypothetical protein [Burkholderiales bacterium]
MAPHGDWFILGWGDFALIALIVWLACDVMLGILRSDVANLIQTVARERIVMEKLDSVEGRVGEEAYWTRKHIDDRLDVKLR